MNKTHNLNKLILSWIWTWKNIYQKKNIMKSIKNQHKIDKKE